MAPVGHQQHPVFLSRDGVRLNTAAILVGIVAGLGAVVFRITIFAAQAVFFGATLNPGAVSFAPIHVPNLFGALAPWARSGTRSCRRSAG